MSGVLGIDLGSLSARIAYSENAVVKKLTNKQKNAWDCTISFSDKKILFETYGKNLQNTISDHLALLGKTADYKITDLSNEIIVNEQKLLKYKILCKNEKQEFFPEEITALILRNIINSLNVYTKYCVLTVPINFNPARREALINAAKIADLEVLRLINKPTAAALGFYYENTLHQNPKTNILVYHIGVSHCDVTIIEITNKKIEVKHSESFEGISKNLIDNLFFDHIVDKYNIKLENSRKLQNLKNKIEKVKIELSSELDSELEIDFERVELIMREDLNEVIENIVSETSKDLITKALINCKLSYVDINDVLLLGMSTKIAVVKETVMKLFKKVNIHEFYKIEDLAAKGAAVLGAYLCNGDFLNDTTVVDLSYPVIQTENRVLFDTQSKVPCRNFDETNQNFKVYSDKTLMRRYELLDILPRACVRLDFILSINGTLRINAIDESRDKVVKINDISRIDEDLIEELKERNVELYEDNCSSSTNETLINLQKIIVDNMVKIDSLDIDEMYKEIFFNIKRDVEEWKNESGLTKKMIMSKTNAINTYLKYIFSFLGK